MRGLSFLAWALGAWVVFWLVVQLFAVVAGVALGLVGR